MRSLGCSSNVRSYGSGYGMMSFGCSHRFLCVCVCVYVCVFLCTQYNKIKKIGWEVCLCTFLLGEGCLQYIDLK